MGHLRDHMIDEMKIRGYSDATIRLYVPCVGALAYHYRKSPLEIGQPEIRDYFLGLMEKGASKARLHVAYCALKAFYTMHGRPGYMDFMRRPRVPYKIPAVLDESEIEVILSLCRTLRFKTLFALIYSAGLRISEALNLRVDDIDLRRKVIHVRSAKYRKERLTILGEKASILLGRYVNRYRPESFLFHSPRDKAVRMSKRRAQQEFQNLVREARIPKEAHVHTLRHSFATHLMEHDTNIYYIMKLLGHASIKTTALYLHMQRLDRLSIESPLDKCGISIDAFPEEAGQLRLAIQ